MITAKEKIEQTDQLSGVLMTEKAKKDKSVFSDTYGKQDSNNKFEKYGAYKQLQVYFVDGKRVKPKKPMRKSEELIEIKRFVHLLTAPSCHEPYCIHALHNIF
jgi:hypothetical protein